jgi:Uma2 family endonuclease
MIALKEHFPRFTPEEYFAWEEQQLERHEYIDGEVYAMSGGTINHGDIALNFGVLLKTHMRGRGCKTLNSDCRVKIFGMDKYVYPDTSVNQAGDTIELKSVNLTSPIDLVYEDIVFPESETSSVI